VSAPASRAIMTLTQARTELRLTALPDLYGAIAQ